MSRSALPGRRPATAPPTPAARLARHAPEVYCLLPLSVCSSCGGWIAGEWGDVSRFLAVHGRLLRALAVVPILVLGMMAAPFLQQVANAATVSDNFKRANGGLGSNWTTVAGTTAPKIANNTVQPGTAGAFPRYPGHLPTDSRTRETVEPGCFSIGGADARKNLGRDVSCRPCAPRG